MNRRKFLSLFGIGAAYPLLGLYPRIGNAFPGSQFAPSTSSTGVSRFVDPFENEPGTKISLIACGGAGVAMAQQIDKVKLGIHEVIAIDTSKRALHHATNADRKLLIEGKSGKKPTTGNQAFQLAWQSQEAIRKVIGHPHLAIIATGLGGSTGSGISNVVSQLARRSGIFTLAFATQPFAFEDKYHQINSDTGLNALIMNTDNVLILPNDSLQRSVGPDTAYNEVLKVASNALAQYLWNTCSCLTRQGLVGMDFEDVRTVLAAGPQSKDGTHSSRIGCGAAEGPARAPPAEAGPARASPRRASPGAP